MRAAITLVRRHGETTFQVVAGPEVSIPKQVRDCKAAAQSGRENPEYAEIQLWMSDHGISKSYRFLKPGEKRMEFVPPAPASETEQAEPEIEQPASETEQAVPEIEQPVSENEQPAAPASDSAAPAAASSDIPSSDSSPSGADAPKNRRNRNK